MIALNIKKQTKEDKAEQAALKAQYRELLKTAWNDEKMVDFCSKQAERVVELDGGYLTDIDRPRIETSFCFGYSDSAYNTDDYDRANAAAARAAHDEQYFICENMRNIAWNMKKLKDSRLKYYRYVKYNGSPSDSKLAGITCLRTWEDPRPGYVELSDSDRAKIWEGYAAVARNFLKRLNTYLKRYGMTKINTWSYWRDA